MTTVHHVMALVFVLVSMHTDTMERAVVLKCVCTVSTKTEVVHAINHDNVASIHVNSSPAM